MFSGVSATSSTSTADSKDKKSIPAILHFIWAGGKDLMLIQGVELISQWIIANKGAQGFQAWLWIDKQTANSDIVKNYTELFAGKNITVYDEEDKKNSQQFIILKDINKHGLRNEIVAYELDKLRPNYGSSSDLLRYEILFKFGGFYCDCTDVGPGKDSLIKIFSQKFSKHEMYLDHCPQQPDASSEKLKQFGINELGNDTFASTQTNPVFLQMLITSRRNYDLPDQFQLSHIITAHSGNNTKDITVWRTGPGLVRQVLVSQGYKESEGMLLDKNATVEVRRVRDGILQLTLPKSNTGSWLNKRITKYADKQEAINAVIKTIQFEAAHFKILRLDDHLQDLLQSTDEAINVADALASLNNPIQESLKTIKYVQLTGQFPETLAYMSNHSSIPTLFNLSKEQCIAAINAQAYLNDFLNAEKVASQKRSELQGQASQRGMTVECLILSSQRKDVKKNLCLQMQNGVKFFGYLSLFLGKFKEDISQEVRLYLLERVHKYKIYSGMFNEEVEQKYRIDSATIDRLLESLSIKNDAQTEQKHQQLKL